jgi:hypothetical protein
MAGHVGGVGHVVSAALSYVVDAAIPTLLIFACDAGVSIGSFVVCKIMEKKRVKEGRDAEATAWRRRGEDAVSWIEAGGRALGALAFRNMGVNVGAAQQGAVPVHVPVLVAAPALPAEADLEQGLGHAEADDEGDDQWRSLDELHGGANGQRGQN